MTDYALFFAITLPLKSILGFWQEFLGCLLILEVFELLFFLSLEQFLSLFILLLILLLRNKFFFLCLEKCRYLIFQLLIIGSKVDNHINDVFYCLILTLKQNVYHLQVVSHILQVFLELFVQRCLQMSHEGLIKFL